MISVDHPGNGLDGMREHQKSNPTLQVSEQPKEKGR